MNLQEEVKAVETKVEEVAGEVKVEATKLVEEVKTEVKKLTQELTTEEKLFIRETENKYLKAQIELNRLSQIAGQAQRDFSSKVEELTKRYLLNPAEYIFDNVELIFKKK